MLTQRTYLMKSIAVFQNKRKSSEKSGFFFFFFYVFAHISLGLREDSWILLSTLHSVCCINTCHVASGKHHCILIKGE